MSSIAPPRGRTASALLLVLAAVPIAAMLFEVLRAPRLHFLDYWSVFGRITEPDGDLNPRGVLTYQNEHPMFLPGLLFWAEAKLLGGFNQVLGFIDVVVAGATVFLMRRLLPPELGDTRRAALTAAFSFLLFSTSGLHNFAFGFSGTGWLSANLAAVGAILLTLRGKHVWALVVGLVGCACYGTAFALWPALAVINWLRRQRVRWVVTPLVACLAIVVVWAFTYGPKPSLNRGNPLGLDSYLATVAATLGQLWSTNIDIATGTGTVTALLVAGFAWLAVRRRLATSENHPQTPWVGVAVYAAGAATMISVARAGAGLTPTDTGRYASIPALALCAVLALVVISWPVLSTVRVVALAMTIGLTTYAIGSAQAANVRSQFGSQPLLAVAMRTGADAVVTEFRAKPDTVPAVKGIGAYPFNGGFTLGCKGLELGGRVDLASIPDLPERPDDAGNAGFVETPVRGDAVIGGWAFAGDKRADCVLVTDRHGMIKGGGLVGIPRPELMTVLGVAESRGGWRAVASPDLDGGVIIVSTKDGLRRVSAGVPR
ncbi:hypothetical protein NLX83_09945 [Allokutzneria sp. A3M-2-11 16]|uniref:hypothetical protein n=1 Tax=Allokutzneria sp. A3M-2-11 16 TaxID=2962043 RepID=UPI0020B7686F|nr:hypothetical protein [Allokutzneria sp. A3M-2-11 16]MCP3799577.1 hypothetical protein [Allokutzneria sp. A3M-2-11 16]